MRTIEFRGLRTDGMGWVHGDLYHGLNDEVYINHVVQVGPTSRANKQTMVIRESVGEFTGLYDRNGVKVFEGDNVTINGKEYFIRFNMGVFVAESVTANHLSLLPWEFNGTDITVTGNLHEPATVRE